MKNFLISLKQGTFPFLIAISALSVSASAAFYSVSGLSKLFAGAEFAVILMASSLEFAKLVIASLLYQYWDKLNKWLRTYLSIATLILVLITSMGIYGFLSAAYSVSSSEMSVVDNKVKFLTQKKNFYEKDVVRYDEELERISNNISTLSNAKSTSIQIKDASVEGGVRTTVSTAELRLAQQRIEVEEENRKEIQSKRETVADSLQKYQLEILDLENNIEIAGELGPLKYLSALTDISMDRIINYLLLVIIFVFDPLAISLVIAANFAFEQLKPKPKENLYGEIENDFSEWDDLEVDLDDLPDLDEEEYVTEEEVMEELDSKEIEVIDPEFIELKENLNEKKIEELPPTLKENIQFDEIEEKLSNNKYEIDELEKSTKNIINTVKSIDDYLKHHGPYYSSPGIDLDKVKNDNKLKPRSQPKGKLGDDVKLY